MIVDDRTQVGFPLPPDETERLEALSASDVRDYEAVASFDRLTTLVANHFDISIAFVGLIGEAEERFVACHGADWTTLAREDSICTYAILEEEVTVVDAEVQLRKRDESFQLRVRGLPDQPAGWQPVDLPR